MPRRNLTRAAAATAMLASVIGLAAVGPARASAAGAAGGRASASCENVVWADDVADSGKLTWQRSLPFPADNSWNYPLTPVVAGKVAAYADGDTLYGLRLANGSTAWRDSFTKGSPGSINILTAWKGSLILLLGPGSGAPSLVAVNPATGAVRWRTKLTAPGAYYDYVEVTSDGVGAVLTLADTLQAVDLSSGHLLWSGSFRKDTTVTAVRTMLIVNSKPTNESPTTLRGVVARTGRTVWTSSDFPNAFTQLPGPDGLLLGYGFHYPVKGVYPVRALSAATGQLAWQLTPAAPVDEVLASAAGVLVTAGGAASLGNPSPLMYFADPATGRVRWSASGTSTDNTAPALITGADVVSVTSTTSSAAVVDRSAATGSVRWTAKFTSVWLNRFLARPSGGNVLLTFTDAKQGGKPAQVRAIGAAGGKSGATSVLPATAEVVAPPAVAGSQALFEPAWWFC